MFQNPPFVLLTGMNCESKRLHTYFEFSPFSPFTLLELLSFEEDQSSAVVHVHSLETSGRFLDVVVCVSVFCILHMRFRNIHFDSAFAFVLWKCDVYIFPTQVL